MKTAQETRTIAAPPARKISCGHQYRWAIFLLIAALAMAVRLPRLADRPMHTDEAVNAYITGQLLSGEVYRYDGRDRHGPALCALTLPIARAAGARNLAGLDERMLRLVPVIVGALAVLLFVTVARETGMIAATIAALLWAFAPLPLYYSRYFIHETLFAAATLGLISFGWRAIDLGSLAYGLAAGACAGVMLACKETALLNYAAVGAAAVWWLFDARHVRNEAVGRAPVHWSRVLVAVSAASAACLLFVLLIYTWGFRHWRGPLDLLESFPHFLRRASGEGHEKPFWWYWKLLANGYSGGALLALALLGGVNIGCKATQPERLDPESEHGPNASITLRLFLVYTVAICAIHCAIPYKTPWLALNLWLPLSVLTGCGCSALWRWKKSALFRGILVVAVVALAFAIGRDTRLLVFLRASDERNPYAYAHTVDDLLRLPERLDRLALKHPAGRNMRIAVVSADAWPLPWYLRKFPNTGFWQPNQDPGLADLYLTSPEAAERIPNRIEGRRPEFFGLRPDVLAILWCKEQGGSE